MAFTCSFVTVLIPISDSGRQKEQVELGSVFPRSSLLPQQHRLSGAFTNQLQVAQRLTGFMGWSSLASSSNPLNLSNANSPIDLTVRFVRAKRWQR